MKVLLYVLCFLIINSECQVTGNEALEENETVKQAHDENKPVAEESVRVMKTKTQRANEAVNEKSGEEKDEASLPPNIVLFLADDLGYGDLSFSGHPTSRTPEIDALARQSRYFTHSYVTSPLCSPSRASLLTGRQHVRSGVYPGAFVADNTLGLPREETTLAAILKSKGYETLIAGKWHLGVGLQGEYLPTHFGFDHYLGLPYSHNMCPCYTCFPGPVPCQGNCSVSKVSCPLYSDTTIVEQPVDLLSLTPRLVDAAVTFIDDAASSGTPFFLYFPFLHVHHPQFASEEFAGTSLRGKIGDALREMDWAVGRVVAALDQHGLLSSTLIWFLSDNGPSLRRHERGGCAGPLRCGKGTTWEGGVRVPMFVHWPAQVPPGLSDGLVSALDLLPTVASLVGFNTSGLTLDGVDISPLLWDPSVPSPRQYMAVYPSSPSPEVGPLAVTSGAYKAHFYTMGSDVSDADNYDPMCPGSHPLTPHDPPLLFHLHSDPGERFDLAADPQYSGVLSDLTAWRDDHMNGMTWREPRTVPTDPSAEPCCTSPSCTPFPQCCDCPPSTLTTPSSPDTTPATP